MSILSAGTIEAERLRDREAAWERPARGHGHSVDRGGEGSNSLLNRRCRCQKAILDVLGGLERSRLGGLFILISLGARATVLDVDHMLAVCD